MALELLTQLDAALKRQGPFLSLLALTLLAAMPTGTGAFGALLATLPLVVLFAVLAERPEHLPRTAVFACGLFQDLMFAQPLGLTALAFIILREIVALQRQPQFGLSLWRQWLGFMLAALLVGGLIWGFMSIWRGALLDPVLPLVQALAGVALYPWVARLVRACVPALPAPA